MQHASHFNSDRPAYLEQLPCAKHAWSDVTTMLNTVRKTVRSTASEHSAIELEIRFGTRNQGFRPGIPQHAFETLVRRYETGRDWVKKVDWHNVHVFFHGSALPGDTRRIRTETTFPPGCDPELGVESTHKELVCNQDYRVMPLTETNATPFDMRLALNIEHCVSDESIPEHTVPSSVHIKTRKVYQYVPSGETSPAWGFMFTKRWVGATLKEAKIAQETQAPVYEVEIECLNVDYLMTKDPGKLAVKMLAKACDILDILSPEVGDRSSYMIEPANNMLWARNKMVSKVVPETEQ